MRGSSRYKLTAQIQKAICSFIRAGAYPQRAAQAAGIPPEVFADWVRQGNVKKPNPLYRDFAQAIAEAKAQAQITAETRVFQGEKGHEGALAWLRHGPGKESADDPGWTSPVKQLPRQTGTQVSIFNDPVGLSFIAKLRQLLSGHPELLQAVAQALADTTAPALPALPDKPSLAAEPLALTRAAEAARTEAAG